jgi:hypothetical protein
MEQSTAKVSVKPLEFCSVFERRGLVGLLVAPPDYGVLPRMTGAFAEAMDAPEIGAHMIEPFLRFLPVRGATRSAYATSVW